MSGPWALQSIKYSPKMKRVAPTSFASLATSFLGPVISEVPFPYGEAGPEGRGCEREGTMSNGRSQGSLLPSPRLTSSLFLTRVDDSGVDISEGEALDLHVLEGDLPVRSGLGQQGGRELGQGEEKQRVHGGYGSVILCNAAVYSSFL